MDHHHQEEQGRRWQDYWPLIVVIGLSASAAWAMQVHAAAWRADDWMNDFMGVFLLFFSSFKLFDLAGFATGFAKYDLLAKPVRAYGYLYPFLELALGLGYLSRWQPRVVLTATVILMVFGSVGVFVSLARGLNLNCACMGNILKVPLSTVALVEDLGMAAMAGWMLMMR